MKFLNRSQKYNVKHFEIVIPLNFLHFPYLSLFKVKHLKNYSREIKNFVISVINMFDM